MAKKESSPISAFCFVKKIRRCWPAYRIIREKKIPAKHTASARSHISNTNEFASQVNSETMNQEIHKLEYNCRCLCIQIGLQ